MFYDSEFKKNIFLNIVRQQGKVVESLASSTIRLSLSLMVLFSKSLVFNSMDVSALDVSAALNDHKLEKKI